MTNAIRKSTATLLATLFVSLVMFVSAAEACACGGYVDPVLQAQAAARIAAIHNVMPLPDRAYRAYTFYPPVGYKYGHAFLLVPAS
jgi:hypothetical protein